MAEIRLENVSKSFGSVSVIRDLSLTVNSGELMVFLGPSGSGKSTLLRMIAGLETIDSGTLTIDGERSEHLPPGQRNVAMVFQNYALYPHMTVRQNMAFGLENIGLPRAEIEARVAEAARMLRRSAPACRHRSGHRQGAQGLPLRRAALQSRCGAQGAHPCRARPASPADEGDDDLCHP
jgi:multiple sugar transport system ATP-binding protein